MKRKLIKFLALTIISALIVLIYLPIFLVDAATLTLVKDTLNRLKAGETSGITHKVILTTVGAVTGGSGANKIIITAPDADDSTWCATAGDGTASSCTDESSTDLPGTLTVACLEGSGGSSYDVITVSGVDDLSATTKYCVDINDTGTVSLGTPSAGSHTMTIATNNGSSDVDTGDVMIQIIADDVVVTTATVVASLTFTVDDNDIFFGTLGTGAAKWADNTADGSDSSAVGHTMTVGTNSTAGYSVTYNGTALTSGSDKIPDSGNTTISGSANGTPNSEEFAIGVTVDGDATIASGYEQGSSNFKFVESTTTTLVSETVQSDTETISVYYIANIASDTEAHTDYTSSITYIATGNF